MIFYRDEFNDLFKSCAQKIANKLITHYKAKESVIDLDSEMKQNGTMSRDYEDLYSNMAFSDVDLEVEGKTLRAHKVILSST